MAALLKKIDVSNDVSKLFPPEKSPISYKMLTFLIINRTILACQADESFFLTAAVRGSMFMVE